MPVSYKFVDREGNTMKLDDVDRMLCKDLGIRASDSDFCMDYLLMVDLGLAILMKFHGCEVTPEAFDKTVAELTFDDEDAGRLELYKKYLCGEFVYHAWR